MNTHEIIEDYDGREITMGTYVRVEDFDPWHPDYGTVWASAYTGFVTNMGDWDGEGNDEGRIVGVPPYIEVTFDNGVVDYFRTSDWQFAMGSDPIHGKVEEICACTAPKVGHVKLREAS